MKVKHLYWIIPLCFLTGVLFYAILDDATEKQFMPLVENCLGYEYNMDNAIILLQLHCLRDLTINRNTAFCNEYSNQSNILSLYNWSEK